MSCIDDRFLSLLADNCVALKNINFNGCKFVTDKGLANIARFLDYLKKKYNLYIFI